VDLDDTAPRAEGFGHDGENFGLFEIDIDDLVKWAIPHYSSDIINSEGDGLEQFNMYEQVVTSWSFKKLM